jgi:hypothetical protein
MNRGTELSDVEEAIKEAESAAKVCSIRIKSFQKKTDIICFKRELLKYEKLINNVQTDEVALDEKIAKRVEEKDRHARTLDRLRGVRYRNLLLIYFNVCVLF